MKLSLVIRAATNPQIMESSNNLIKLQSQMLMWRLFEFVFFVLGLQKIYAGWIHQGCYLDNHDDAVFKRFVSSIHDKDSPMVMTSERCQWAAQSNGFDVIGLQFDSKSYICASGFDNCNYNKYGPSFNCSLNDEDQENTLHIFTYDGNPDTDICNSTYPYKCFSQWNATAELIEVVMESNRERTNCASGGECYGFQFVGEEQCPSLFEESLDTLSKANQSSYAADVIPPHLLWNFTMGGRIKVKSWFFPLLAVENIINKILVWDRAQLKTSHEDHYCFNFYPFPCKLLFEKYGRQEGTECTIVLKLCIEHAYNWYWQYWYHLY